MGMHSMDRYIQIFKDVFGWQDDKYIRASSMENNREWDSFMQMELILAVEETFRVQFCGEDVLKFTSFEEGLLILEQKGVE